MNVIAVLLIALGIVAFAYGGFSYKSHEKLIDAGPVEVTREKTNRVRLPPVVGGAAIAAGLGILVLGRRH